MPNVALFVSVAGPCMILNRDAVNETSLGELIENLPEGYVSIRNLVCIPTKRLCPLYYGDVTKDNLYSSFSFYAN